MDMIESIEIVKGAASSLYGVLQAGIINIITKKQMNQLDLLQKNLEYSSSFNQAIDKINAGNQLINISGRLANSGISMNLNYAKSYSNGMSRQKEMR